MREPWESDAEAWKGDALSDFWERAGEILDSIRLRRDDQRARGLTIEECWLEDWNQANGFPEWRCK
jgi:hypothetical protein